MPPIDDYAQRIREQGYRLTPQRQLILEAVTECGGHCTVDEVYDIVSEAAPAISLATVYRTLNFLCELQLITAADVGHRTIVYEIAGETPHHHLICRNCNATIELTHNIVQAFFNQVEENTDFKPDMKHLALFGLCKGCKDEQT